MSQKPLIFCALDTADLTKAKDLARLVGPITGGLKLGLQFFSTHGPQGIEVIRNAAPEAALFLDLKFHDIPNTVAGAVKSISETFKPAYLNVHAAGGIEMMKAARMACDPKTKLLGVTILTSLDESILKEVGYQEGLSERVNQLGKLTREAGLSGVVCSSVEIQNLRQLLGEEFILMVPGIRPLGAERGDQKRVMTPERAISLGATHLVIGRPITKADDPAAAAQAILDEL